MIQPREEAEAALQSIYDAVNIVSKYRGDFGAAQNRLEFAYNSRKITEENLTEAYSRIRDADMAKEATELTKMSILSQSATAMLAQANSQPEAVLSLLGS